MDRDLEALNRARVAAGLPRVAVWTEAAVPPAQPADRVAALLARGVIPDLIVEAPRPVSAPTDIAPVKVYPAVTITRPPVKHVPSEPVASAPVASSPGWVVWWGRVSCAVAGVAVAGEWLLPRVVPVLAVSGVGLAVATVVKTRAGHVSSVSPVHSVSRSVETAHAVSRHSATAQTVTAQRSTVADLTVTAAMTAQQKAETNVVQLVRPAGSRQGVHPVEGPRAGRKAKPWQREAEEASQEVSVSSGPPEPPIPARSGRAEKRRHVPTRRGDVGRGLIPPEPPKTKTATRQPEPVETAQPAQTASPFVSAFRLTGDEGCECSGTGEDGCLIACAGCGQLCLSSSYAGRGYSVPVLASGSSACDACVAAETANDPGHEM